MKNKYLKITVISLTLVVLSFGLFKLINKPDYSNEYFSVKNLKGFEVIKFSRNNWILKKEDTIISLTILGGVKNQESFDKYIKNFITQYSEKYAGIIENILETNKNTNINKEYIVEFKESDWRKNIQFS